MGPGKPGPFLFGEIPYSGHVLEVTAFTYLRNLVGFLRLTHTRFTYHRTWETGLRVAI